MTERATPETTALRTPPVTVRDIMRAPVVTIGRDDTLWAAMEAMIGARLHHLAVVAEGHAVGVIADRDLASVWAMDPLGLKHRHAGDAMTGGTAFVRPDMDVVAAAEEMLRQGADAFVVVDRQGAPVGMVTDHDLLGSLVGVCHDVAHAWHPGHPRMTPD